MSITTYSSVLPTSLVFPTYQHPNAGEPIEKAVYTIAFVKQKLNKIQFFMVYNKQQVFHQSDQDALGISVILSIFSVATMQNDFVLE